MPKESTKSPKADATKPVQVGESKDTPGLFAVIDMSQKMGNHIPRQSNPTYLHASHISANDEACRLASIYPGREFAVFQCTGFMAAKISLPEWRAVSDQDVASVSDPF